MFRTGSEQNGGKVRHPEAEWPELANLEHPDRSAAFPRRHVVRRDERHPGRGRPEAGVGRTGPEGAVNQRRIELYRLNKNSLPALYGRTELSSVCSEQSQLCMGKNNIDLHISQKR